VTDEAFQAFYLAEAPMVFRTVYLLSRDRDTALDATQEAFARALERWQRLRGQPWAGGWVTTTAVNEIKRSFRRRRTIEALFAAQDDVDDRLDIWSAVSRLPLRQQQAVILHYRDDRPVGEIAAVLGMREGTVRTHLARARATLRPILEGAHHAAER
jgi:RNA polymerase sigma-70 factor, ECF subfamily